MYCCAGGRARQLRLQHAFATQTRLDPVLHWQRQLRHVRHQLSVEQAKQRVRKACSVGVAADAQPLLERHHRNARSLQGQQVAYRTAVLVLCRRRVWRARGGVVARHDGCNASLHNLRRLRVSAGRGKPRCSSSSAPRRSG